MLCVASFLGWMKAQRFAQALVAKYLNDQRGTAPVLELVTYFNEKYGHSEFFVLQAIRAFFLDQLVEINESQVSLISEKFYHSPVYKVMTSRKFTYYWP